DTNPQLNAPFGQQWVEWPMGGDTVSYVIKKALVDVTGSVPVTDNLFWLLTFPLTAIAAYPVLRWLRCSHMSALLAAVLFALTPYHFRNGMGHENLAFYVAVPLIVLLCVQVLDLNEQWSEFHIGPRRGEVVGALLAAAFIG